MTLPERITYKTLVWTWGLYAFGSLYVVGPMLAWVLGGLALMALFLGPAMREDLRPTGPIPAMIWLWVAGMFVMLVALWVGHINWDLGLKGTIKSSIGWAKGWALLALFPLAGAVLQIKRDVIIRAHCKLALITLILLPILAIAPMIGLPESIFTSPLKAVGGPGPEYFTVYFYTLDPSSWTPRWQFYAPWSPFAGLLGVIMVLFALEEKHRGWLIVGCLAGIAMILMSKSRMSLVALVVASVGPRMMPLLLRTWAWMAGAAVVGSLAVLWTPLINAINSFWSGFKSSRADSTRVRETLQRIAHERWEAEAYWFGHGAVRIARPVALPPRRARGQALGITGAALGTTHRRSAYPQQQPQGPHDLSIHPTLRRAAGGPRPSPQVRQAHKARAAMASRRHQPRSGPQSDLRHGREI